MNMNWKQITETEYDEALGCLPPRVHLHDGFLLGEPHDAVFRDGRWLQTFRAYAVIGSKFYRGDPVTVEDFVNEHAKGWRVL